MGALRVETLSVALKGFQAKLLFVAARLAAAPVLWTAEPHPVAASAAAVDPKQVLRWRHGTEPCGREIVNPGRGRVYEPGGLSLAQRQLDEALPRACPFGVGREGKSPTF